MADQGDSEKINHRFSILVYEDHPSESYLNIGNEDAVPDPLGIDDELSLQRNSYLRDNWRSSSDIPKLSVHSARMKKFDKFKYKAHELSNLGLNANIKIKEDATDLVIVTEKSSFEKVTEYHDRLPLLESRRAIVFIILSIQQACKLIVTNLLFEYFITLVILFNSIIITLDSTFSYDFSLYEEIFIIIYTTEFLLKTIGLGIIKDKTSYLRSYWNIMDLTILIIAWISKYNTSVFNLAVARVLRILRIFRSISSIQGLKIIFLSLIGSVSKLISSLILLFLWCFVFAVCGIQLFMGLFSYQCMELSTGVLNGEICGARKCESLYVCASSLENPNFGNTSFDNIGYSLLVVFQSITLDKWSNILILTAYSFGSYSLLFFIPLTFIGAFILIDLAIAIIKTNFTKTMNRLKRHVNDKWSEGKMLKDFASKHEDGFVEVDLSEQSTYFENVRRMQQLMSIPPLHLEEENNESRYESESRSESNSNQDSDEIYSKEADNNDKELNETSKIIERRRISVLKSNRISRDIDITSIIENKEKRRSSIRSRRASCDIRAIALIKQQLLDKFRSGKHNKNFKISVINDYLIDSNSTDDIKLLHSKQEKTIGFNYTGYGFRYYPNEINIFQDIIENNFKLSESKYNSSGFALFLLRARFIGANEAFFELNCSVKNFIIEEENKYRINQRICGEWSGYDVDKMTSSYLSDYNYTNYLLWERGLYGMYKKCVYPLKILVHSNIFNKLMILIVLSNTIILSVDHYKISNSDISKLDICNEVLTILFTIEIVFKILGDGFIIFIRDRMNIFDFIVVLLSLLELVLISGTNSGISALRSVRVFRLFRVLRVALIFRYVQSLYHIIKTISQSLSKFFYLFLLLLLFIVIFSLIGVELFKNRFNFNEGIPRSNFDGFQNAFLSIWQVLTMDNWTEIYHNAMRTSLGKFSVFYFIVWIILGNFILLNLFLAILLDSFTESAENLVKNEKKINPRQSVIVEIQSSEGVEETILNIKQQEPLFLNIECEKSYYVFSKSLFLRIGCYKLSNHIFFERGILSVIVLSSIKLVWDTYILNYSQNSIEQTVSLYLDLAFLIIFLFEFTVKSISMGFALDPGSYLRDNWNKIDFIIVSASLVDISTTSINIQSIKVLRLLRTLRPLRFLSHNLSMKIVVTALIESLISICNVVVVLLLFGLIFAIIGVYLFGLDWKRFAVLFNFHLCHCSVTTK